MAPLRPVLRRLDALQKRHAWLGFPLAVAKKFADDRAGYLAALIAYYGFFSLFPLLLVLVTILGFILGDDSALASRIEDSVLRQLPVIGDQIRVRSLEGSALALAVGVVGALWAGTGVVAAFQNALDEVWAVPIKSRRGVAAGRARALLMLGVLGAASMAATLLAGLGTSQGSLSVPFKVAGIVSSLLVNLIVFLLAFRVLTVAKVSWRDVLPGAVIAAVAWAALQAIGTYYVNHQLRQASEVYGLFAVVIGLLTWLYLGAQVTLYAAEVNVVLARRLWPRSLVEDLTDADRATLRGLAKVEERRRDERVDASFGDEPTSPAGRSDAPDA
jgi:membrane protein